MDEQGGGWFSWLKPEVTVIKGAPWSFSISVGSVAVLIYIGMNFLYHENLQRKDDIIASLRLKEQIDEPPKLQTHTDDYTKFKSNSTVTISGHTYANEVVEMDGKTFIDCIFRNVTMNYHGVAPIVLIRPRFEGTTTVETDNVAAKTFMKLYDFLRSRPNLDHLEFGERDMQTGNFNVFGSEARTEEKHLPQK